MTGTSLSDLPIEASITLDLTDCAAEIEVRCSDWLLPPPKGIYSNTQVEPVMVDGGNYYTLTNTSGGYVRVSVNDLNTVNPNKSIYTSKGHKDVVVVNTLQLQNKEKCLSNLPIRPYRGMKVVECLVNNQIDSYIAYKRSNKDLFDAVRKHIRPDCTDAQVEECFEYVSINYADVRSDIFSFMGKHNWNIYFLKVKGTIITLQRSIDWRAYDWMCRMESKEWS
jgi:hypothetical protein